VIQGTHASPGSFSGQGSGWRPRPPECRRGVGQCNPGSPRHKRVWLLAASVPCPVVTLSDMRGQGERAHCRRSGRLCRRRGGLCMRRRWGRSVRCGPGHWSVAGPPGPARNSGVSGQNSRSVPRGGHRQRSQTQSGAIARPVASPEPQALLSQMLSARYEANRGRLEPVSDPMPGRPARGTRPGSGHG
jgi:hypothetical protein